MLTHTTRSRVIQAWLVTLALVVAFEMALGVRVTLGSAVMLLALCLVPLAIVSTLWTVAHPTVAEVLPRRRSPRVTTANAQALAMGDAPTDEGGFQ